MQKITFEQEIHTFHIDFLGHVNNGIYIQWMEIGRTKLLEAAGMVTAEILKQSFAPLLVETTIKYKVPLYLMVIALTWMSGCLNCETQQALFNSAFITASTSLWRMEIKKVFLLTQRR